jgi:hypothetical protein
MSGTTSRISPPTKSKILEEFVADLWKISRGVSLGISLPLGFCGCRVKEGSWALGVDSGAGTSVAQNRGGPGAGTGSAEQRFIHL